MKRLVLFIRSGGTIRRVEFLAGDVLALNQRIEPGRQYVPGLVSISDVVGAQFEDPEAEEAARAERRRHTAIFTDNDHEEPLRRPERKP